MNIIVSDSEALMQYVKQLVAVDRNEGGAEVKPAWRRYHHLVFNGTFSANFVNKLRNENEIRYRSIRVYIVSVSRFLKRGKTTACL